MAIRFYLMPVLVVGTTRSPKYFSSRANPNALIQGVDWQGMDFGLEPVYLIAANVDATQQTTLAAQSDVTVIPAVLDNTLGANRNTVAAALEGWNLPGNWVTAGMTYAFVLRVLVGVILLAQRFNVVDGGRLFPVGVTLDTTYQNLPAQFRTNLLTSVDQLGYDRSSLTATSTMRDLLQAIGQQAAPVTFLGVTI